MKNYSLKYILLLSVVSLLAGCSEPAATEKLPVEPSGDVIRLSGAGDGITAEVTRADAFPNTTIGVMAAYHRNGGTAATTDWTTYSPIANTKAVAGAADDEGVYGFTWENGPKYWPFDMTQMVFMAYSPYTDNTLTNILISSDFKKITMTLKEDMQDVLYASVNTAYTPFDKSDGTANLGEFKHALSKLTIEVAGLDPMNPDIVVTDLEVFSSRTVGTLDLTLGDAGMALADADEENGLTQILVTEPESFSVDNILRREVLMFPGTEDDVRIDIQLSDGIGSLTRSYEIADFPNKEDGTSLTLERGKNTTVRFLVQSVQVNPSDITIEGILKDWTDGGSLGVTIE